MPVFEKAPAGVNSHLGKIVEKYHGGLHKAGVTFEVLMASPTVNKNGESSGPPLKKNGFPVLALVKITSLADRTAGMPDAMLQLDAEAWKDMKMPRKDALLDHMMTYLTVKTDKDDATVTDDQDRPKLQRRKHDREVGWFDEVVRRHQFEAPEYQQFDSIAKAMQQLNLPFLNAVG